MKLNLIWMLTMESVLESCCSCSTPSILLLFLRHDHDDYITHYNEELIFISSLIFVVSSLQWTLSLSWWNSPNLFIIIRVKASQAKRQECNEWIVYRDKKESALNRNKTFSWKHDLIPRLFLEIRSLCFARKSTFGTDVGTTCIQCIFCTSFR